MNNNSNKMQIRESLAMDVDGTTVESSRGYLITRMTLLATVAIFGCLLLGSGLLIYHFASCDEHHASTLHHTTLCEHQHSTSHHHQQHAPAPSSDGSASSTTQKTLIEASTSRENPGETIPAGDNVPGDTGATGADGMDQGGQRAEDGTVASSVREDLRLPRSIEPVAYDIRLIPWLVEDNFTFLGTVEVLVNVLEDCSNVTLHVAALNIHSASVERSTGRGEKQHSEEATADESSEGAPLVREMVEIDHNLTVASKQFYVLMLKTPLRRGEQYVVRLRYDGVLNDYLQGFYRSSYTANNETRWIATTQFQPTDARRAFPCFDEPALKARFNISIARTRDMISLSNMPRLRSYEASEPELQGYVWDVYQQSVPMSTYLVAFVVCDYLNLTSGNFAVWARADAIGSARYALSVGPKLLKFLEDFFHIKYPLPKVDMIALPDFSAGAMENWGLITYRETAMLYEENVSAISNKQHVITVVAHELAHQWFGNLVTPSWWTDLWLNEGFASYMEYLGVDAVEPAWKSMEQFVVNELHNVFSLDALSSSHQISVEVHNPEEIHEIFDKISYGKGATIIRMMDHFLTTEVFKRGLTNYLNDKKYQSASQDDLWDYLTNEARRGGIFDEHTSVKEIMDTWTLQTGFPVVFVQRDYESDSIEFRQERFSFANALNGTDAAARQSERFLWWIPITYTTLGDSNFQQTKPSIWMKAEEALVINNHDIPSHDWMIVNVQQTGYYRVNYDERNWQMIVRHLQDRNKYKTIAASNRAQLIDDALNLARAGYLDYGVALNVTRYLVHETDYVPWKAAIAALNYIDSMFIRTRNYGLFKKYSMDLLENIYREVGFEDHRDSPLLTVYKRISVLKAVCHLGNKDCVNHCLRKYYEWMHQPNPDINNPISPNLKSTVYCTAIKYGDETEWDFAWERFQKATVASEKEILLSAMGCSRVPWILARYLENAMSDEYGIRKQDAFRVFISVADNVIGQPIAFDYMRNNWAKMKSYFGASMSNLNIILKYCTKRFNTESELLELKEFAEIHLKDSGRTIQQAIEWTESNIAWLNRNAQPIVNWLNELDLHHILFLGRDSDLCTAIKRELSLVTFLLQLDLHHILFLGRDSDLCTAIKRELSLVTFLLQETVVSRCCCTMERLQIVSVLLFVPLALYYRVDGTSLSLLQNEKATSDSYRLLAVSEPLYYDLYLDMTDANFSNYAGSVDITIKYTGNGSIFSLNSVDLAINEETLRVEQMNGTKVPLESFTVSRQFEQLYFNCTEKLEPGASYKVHLEFNGTIKTDIFKGVYRSSYRVDGEIKYLATTFFAATYARTVFPCYDEPGHKARFNVKIRHRSHQTALSNMPVIRNTMIDGYSETTFDTTPLMSTYLVAFVVSEMKTLSSAGELFRVYAPENKVNYTVYAHDFAVRAVRALENHFGRQNQMRKIDLVGIPDFAMGAMENWGMITFREDYLIYQDEEETTALAKQKIASVITHELVHMWFGNEVTPEWWTYVWLNEGFANFFEYYITSQLEPAWRLWDQFTLDNVHWALSKDSHSSVRPINYYATDPAVLNGLYDYVVYEKSASVIRMIQNVIGFDTFQQAINDYLRSRSYLTTRPQYLYTSIEKFHTVDLPASVEVIFESWANTPGYPVVMVSIDRTTRTLTASQKRFWMPNEIDTPPQNMLFYIPMNYGSNVPTSTDFEDTSPTFWLTPQDPTATVTLEAGVEWVVVNKQQTGYYRVNYDDESWHKLIEVLNSDQFEDQLPIINRAQLVDDVANLARAGEVGYDVALSLMQYLERETEYIPWATAYNALLHLDRMFSNHKEYNRFENYVGSLASHVFSEMNLFDTDSHLNRLHRDKSVYLACYFGVEACLDAATKIIKEALADETLKIPKEVQNAFFCALHKYDLLVEGDYGVEIFQKYWLATDQYQPLMDKFINALGCSRNLAMNEFYLQMIEINETALPITVSMKNNILNSMIKGGPATRSAAFRFVSARFDKVSNMLNHELSAMFNALGDSVNSPREYDMLKELIHTHQTSLNPSSMQAATRALAQAEENLHWIAKHSGVIAKWLVEQNFEGDDDDDSGAEAITSEAGLFVLLGIISISLQMTLFRLRVTQSPIRYSPIKMSRTALTLAAFWLPLILASAPVEIVEKVPTSRDTHDDSRYLLPKVSEPINYNLFLDITNYDFYSYNGTVEITFRYTGDQNHFYLNNDGLVIATESIKVTGPDGTDVPVANVIYMEEFEQIYFGFRDRLQTGEQYKIAISFQNNIGTELKGLYRSSYLAGNTTRYLATTHFESTYARSVFPCYDEPSYKATFNVKIRHRSEYRALSNMPAINSVTVGDYTETTFDTTPLMSTYLLAFVISDFKTLSHESDRFRVFAAESKVAHTGYALEFLGNSLRTLENFFGRQYQLPKVDLIAIPDFAMGAMENWGLITFREQYLIYEEGVTTARTKQNIADLITHELTHMWFGNEVTPEWWTYLWLSEGFARYFEYYITSQLEPTWNLWQQFIVNNVHSALSQDCNSNNRMMSYYATDPAVLNDLFDYVVYAKSASVIRMIQNVIGFDTFRQSLNDYLRSRSYLTTRPQYLYTSIEKFLIVNLPASVEIIVESWANTPGYPVVTVSIDRTTRTLTASQKRFWMPNEIDTPPQNMLFYIPVNYGSNVPTSTDFEDTTPTFWLTPQDPTATVTLEAGVEWVVVNKQQTGYYRVNYDDESWHKLIEVLNSDQFEDQLPVINRAQLVDDVANLARAGEVGYDVALSLMQYLERETEYIPWATAYNALLHLDRMFSSHKEYSRFETFLRTITGCMYENILLTGPMDQISRLHRGNTVYLACYSGVKKCLDDAHVLANKAVQDSSFTIPEEVQTTVFCALHKYPSATFNAQTDLFEKYVRTANSPEDLDMINRFLASVGCARNETIMEYYLTLSAYNYPGLPVTAGQRSQIYLGLINGSPGTRQAALQYLYEHFSTVTYLLTSVTPIFTELGNRINTRLQHEVLKNIVDEYGHMLTTAARAAADAALVKAEQNIRWIEKHAESITSWLVEQDYEGTTVQPPDGGAVAYSVGIAVAFGCAILQISSNVLIR
ncbi:uncharacterized protein LOC121590789 [Anopheles merus]|uniref:uncharacterized protein LOC121590789 n=1 Tax=Anopheles merus TaxID=30066 RepID=UPI001BE411EF|nr:uncharacterized protein LOC121590789 [Anopheles merus]